MESFSVPRILIAGAAAGVGKTILTIGLCHELRKRNINTSCCVTGARLAQASILRRVTGRYVRALDERLLTSNQTLLAIRQAATGADLILIDGKAGLYDSISGELMFSPDSELAASTKTPVVLAVDLRGFSSSVAALVKGYTENAHGFDLAGSILNRRSFRAEQRCEVQEKTLIAESFDALNLAQPLGFVGEGALDLTLPAATLSQERNNTLLPRNFFVELEKLIATSVDLDRLYEIAQAAEPLELDDTIGTPQNRRCRIAVTEDTCFSMGFQDNLDLLRYFGCELVPFSPLADESLPSRIGGVYITGGYVNDYAEELVANQGLAQALRDFSDAGGVLWSEGAGTAYLCREFKLLDTTRRLPGVGIIDAIAEAHPAHPAYVDAVTIEDSIIGRSGLIIKGIASGEWGIKEEGRMLKSLRISRPGAPMQGDGFSPTPQALCTFNFLHFGSNPLVAKSLAEAAEVSLGHGQ